MYHPHGLEWFPFTFRWLARLIGTLLVVFVSLRLVLEGVGPAGTYTLSPLALSTRELIPLGFLLLACFGMLVAWRREELGAAVIGVGLLGFCATFPRGFPVWALGVLSAPALLFLLSWAAAVPPRHK
jgi:hypothetical protein